MLTAYAANSSNAAETTTVSESTADSETSEASDVTDGAAGGKEAAGEQDTSSDKWYSDRDMEQSPDTSEAKTIEVADGQTLSITKERTFFRGLRQTARFWSMHRKQRCSSFWTM